MTAAKASVALAARDSVMERLHSAYGPASFGQRPRVAERYASLARAVAYQQIAGAAATAIWGRVLAALEAEGNAVDPQSMLALGEDRLRSAGLSRSKAVTILGLAEACSSGDVDLASMGRASDGEITESLVSVWGIGEWTVQMFLIFALHRLDVWPTGDLGVRRGWAMAHGLVEPLAAAELGAEGERLRPYRSVAAWWCWREADGAKQSWPS